MREAWRLKAGTFTHVMPNGHEYPIFHDDELALEYINQVTLTGRFTKVCPGLCVAGISIPLELVESYTEERQIVI